MLAEERVLSEIESGALRVSYYFDPTQDPPGSVDEVNADPASPELPATKAFRAAFFGDRLQLTLGPLVLSHDRALAKGRSRYKGRAGVFDLRQSDGKISLRPRESVTVNTIERIRVDGGLGALILPRLTLATAGLVVTPSYIDPWWDGILVLHLSNQSGRRVDLRFGEAIAACRFYKVTGQPLPETFKDEFAEKSHHYGLTWKQILSSDRDPFPLRKRPTPTVFQLDTGGVVDTLKRYGVHLAAAGLSLALVAGVIFWAGNIQSKTDRLESVETTQQRTLERLSYLEAATHSRDGAKPRSTR